MWGNSNWFDLCLRDAPAPRLPPLDEMWTEEVDHDCNASQDEVHLGVLGFGFWVLGLGFGVWGLGFGVWGLGLGVSGLGLRRVRKDLGFWVRGCLGFRV